MWSPWLILLAKLTPSLGSKTPRYSIKVKLGWFVNKLICGPSLTAFPMVGLGKRNSIDTWSHWAWVHFTLQVRVVIMKLWRPLKTRPKFVLWKIGIMRMTLITGTWQVCTSFVTCNVGHTIGFPRMSHIIYHSWFRFAGLCLYHILNRLFKLESLKVTKPIMGWWGNCHTRVALSSIQHKDLTSYKFVGYSTRMTSTRLIWGCWS